MSRHYEEKKERVLEQVRKTLDDLYPAKICKFSKVCKGYRNDAYTCAHEGEAIWYCGYYKQHEEIIKIGKMGKLMKGTEFGDFDV